MGFQLTSTAFNAGQPIPASYTCDGQDHSPPLQWGDPPAGTQSFALIVDAPDAPAGAWVHWVLFNLPAQTRSLPAAVVPAQAERADGSRQGQNSWRRIGYGGPCPPRGIHRYVFKLYALDTALDLAAGATQAQVVRALAGHILGQTELTGTYRRR